MKKLLLIAAILLIGTAAKAQINDHAIGLRAGLGGGISYQHKLSRDNRLELNGAFGIGSSYSTLRLTGIYQWVFDMNSGFNFYVGPAASIGSVSLEGNYAGKGDNGLFVSIGGQLGIEYNFEGIPFQVSVDVLPMFSIVNNYDDMYFDPALAVRYVF